MAEQVEIQLLLTDVNKSLKSIEDFSNKAQKSASQVASSFSTIGIAIAGIGAAFAAIKSVSILADFASEASESEKAITQLNAALRLNGNFSSDAASELKDFADELQKTTQFTDDQVIQSLALASSFGLAANESKKLVQAAADLSAITGVDLNTATRQLSQTLDGTVGRIGELIPATKTLTSEQLKAGAAIDIVADKFRGASQAIGLTFAGATTITGNAFKDLQKTIGSIITQNPVVLAIIKELGAIFNSFSDAIRRNSEAIGSFVSSGLALLISAIPPILRVFAGFVDVVQILVAFSAALSSTARNVISFALSFEPVADAVLFVTRFFLEMVGSFQQGLVVILELARSVPFLGNQFKRLGIDINETIDSVKSSNKELGDFARSLNTQSIQDGFEKAKDAADALDESIIRGLGTAKDALNSGADSAEVFSKKLQEVKKQAQGAADATKGITASSEITQTIQLNVESIGKDIGSNIQNGAKGVSAIFGNIASQIGTQILGPIGGVAGQIVQLLALGPEKVRETITAFIQSIPDVIENIVLGLVEAVLTIIENLDVFLDRLFEKIPIIIERLIQALPKLIAAIQVKLPAIATEFAIQLAAQAPFIAVEMAKAFIKEVPKIVGEIVKEIGKGLGNIGGVVGSIGGGVGDFIGGIGDIFGFASGGTVPQGFPNDSFPAKLTSGEMVIDRSQNERLQEFLDLQSQGSSQPIVVNIQVGEQQLASTILNLNRNGFRLAV